ncbi:MAG: sugar ABC transporter permease [bacterium]
MTRGEIRTVLVGLVFISPWLLGFVAFTFYPVMASLYWSFCDYDVLTKPVWIGLLNYQDMLTDDVFWKSLWNTLYFMTFSVPLGLILSFLIAVMLNNEIKGRPIYRTIYFLPSMVPLIAVAMIWMWIFNGSFGLLNYGLKFLGIQGPEWLANPAWTKPALILTGLWQMGGSIVIYLAALQDVPRELYESAELDGAAPWHKMIHITVPMVSPVIYFNLVMGLIGASQEFVRPFVMMGGGGPDRSALFYAVYIYQNAFQYNQMGYACAMAWVLLVLIMILTWIATAATRRHIYYAGE